MHCGMCEYVSGVHPAMQTRRKVQHIRTQDRQVSRKMRCVKTKRNLMFLIVTMSGVTVRSATVRSGVAV
jgi:hypothetical protein